MPNRRFARVLLIVPVVLLALSGCRTTHPRQVKVQVRDAETNQPIPGASVGYTHPGTIGPLSRSNRRTGKDGEVWLKPARNASELYASANGYLSAGEADFREVTPRPNGRLPKSRDFIVQLQADPTNKAATARE
jgi:hypothetical protein